jgi:4-hydroxy-4-methyl-2-oxoglutarate aldolase
MPHDTDSFVVRLRAVDTTALSDACDQLGLTPSILTHLHAVAAPRRIAGRAITVTLGPADDVPGARHLATAAIESAGPDDVLLVAHQGRTDCAGWGGTLSRAAQSRGVAGTIVDGVVRDVDEADELDYTVISAGATPRTARNRAKEVAWNEPVDIAGHRIEPGDYVVADRSGVIVIAATQIREVLDLAETAVEREAAMALALDQGRPVSEVMGASYEHQMTRHSA